MADLRITCPHCQRDIQCDELWVGHELQCPICQGAFTVPAQQSSSSKPQNPLLPQPPAGGTRLSLGQAQVPASTGRNIPIRNLAEAPPKKKSPLVSILVGVVVVAGLGVGGYYGFGWVKQMQDKANAKSATEARNSDGGEAGHIANLHQVLDATEPGGAGLSSLGPDGEKPPQPGEAAPADAGASTGGGEQGPVTPPKYALDVGLAAIPDSRVNGTISGTDFVAETARVDTVGGVQVLRLFQGQMQAPDREMLVYLRLKAGEKLGGQSLVISKDMRGTGVPQVAKRWKSDPRYAPTIKTYSLGYAMKLELGPATNDTVSGRIYLALPDKEQSVIGGRFTATIYQPDPNALQPQYTMPATTPGTTPTPGPDRSAMERRYGIRR